jgi:hypothetical protein
VDSGWPDVTPRRRREFTGHQVAVAASVLSNRVEVLDPLLAVPAPSAKHLGQLGYCFESPLRCPAKSPRCLENGALNTRRDAELILYLTAHEI